MSDAVDISRRMHAWVDAGLIDEATAERILEFEGVRAEPAATPRSHEARERMQALFGVLGGLLIGLGVLLTVATNWQEIVDPLKVAIIVASLLVAYAAALVADGRGAPRWSGTIAYLVGVGIFAGGLGIIGMVYNVDVHEPFAALLVALAATGIALLAERALLGWVAGAAWLGWLAWELGNSLDGLPEERFASALYSSVLLVGITGIATSFALEGVSRRLGEAGASGWRVLVVRADVLVLPLRSVALLMSLFLLAQATFAWHWVFKLDSAAPRPEQWIALVIAAISCIALVRAGRLEHRRALAAALMIIGTAVVVVAALHEQHVATVAASIVLACGGVGLAWLGLLDSRSDLFAWGIVWLVVLIITRYLDFVFQVDLGGPGFIGAGVLLLVLAWLIGRSRTLWRRREEVVG